MEKKAFIVDDDQICHFITRHLIKTQGLAQEVICFLDAAEALSLLLADLPYSLPDIIFLDLNMPYMSGWEFLDALAPYVDRPDFHTRIFILTSSVDEVDQEKARGYPFVTGYFLKPLGSADLQTIRHLLQPED